MATPRAPRWDLQGNLDELVAEAVGDAMLLVERRDADAKRHRRGEGGRAGRRTVARDTPRLQCLRGDRLPETTSAYQPHD
jgi:hypothetical protein